MNAAGTNCTVASSTGNPQATTTFVNTVRYLNPSVIAGTTKFQVQVSYASTLQSYPPVWTYITVGAAPSSTLFTEPIPNPSPCNNIARSTSSPSASVPGLNLALERDFMLNWIHTKGNMNFWTLPSSDVNYTKAMNLTTLVGYVNIDPSGATSLVSAVTIDSATSNIVQTITLDLTTFIATCAAFGTSQIQTLTGTSYTIPIQTNQYTATLSNINSDSHPQVTSTSTTFNVYIPNTGTTTVSSSVGYSKNVYLMQVSQHSNECPAGQAQLHFAYEMVIGNVNSAATHYVGPMTYTDILFTSSEYANTLFNCYGDYMYSFSTGRSVAALYMSKTSFVIATRCRTLQPGLDTFQKCSYAHTADRIADMGSNIAYPEALNTQHTFFVNLLQVPVVDANGVPSPNVVDWVDVNPNHNPVQFPIQASVKSSVSNSLTVQLQVFGGVLPSAVGTSTSDATITSYVNSSSVINDASLSNFATAIESTGSFTFVLGMVEAQLQSISTLEMTINTNFRFIPLDGAGAVLTGKPIIYWREAFAVMTYVPKNAKASGFCVNCDLLPSVANSPAFDGFSIPVSKLEELSPAQGYAFECDYAFTLRGQQSQNSLNSNRRKFKVMQVLNTTSDPGYTGSMSTTFTITHHQTTIVTSTSANESTPYDTTTLAIAFSVSFGVIVLAILGYATWKVSQGGAAGFTKLAVIPGT
jgi:hypothetical protein